MTPAGLPRIRQALPEDRKKIEMLLKEVNLPIETIAENIANFQVLSDGSLILGVVGLEFYGSSGLLRSLAVDSRYRGWGYGHLLCIAVISYAQRHGVKDLYLLTETSEHFFAKRGFKRIARNSITGTIRESKEFKLICAESAVCMHLGLD